MSRSKAVRPESTPPHNRERILEETNSEAAKLTRRIPSRGSTNYSPGSQRQDKCGGGYQGVGRSGGLGTQQSGCNLAVTIAKGQQQCGHEQSVGGMRLSPHRLSGGWRENNKAPVSQLLGWPGVMRRSKRARWTSTLAIYTKLVEGTGNWAGQKVQLG